MKNNLLIIGKLPPPFMGPAVATQILVNSKLKDHYNLTHFNNTINKTIDTQGRFSFTKIIDVFRLYYKYYKTLKIANPDVILIPISQSTTGFLKDAPFIWMSKKMGKKVIIQLRGSNLKNWLQNSSYLMNWIFSKSMKGLDGVIVLGEKLKYLFADYFLEQNIFVIPNGGDYTIPPKSLKDNTTRILYFANIYKSKGAAVVLEAISHIDLPNCEFTFVGGWRNDEVFKAEFLKKVKSSTQNILVSKPKTGVDKWETFSNADIFVFPPIMPEGHPWVLVEAMSAGLPIISTDQGAITESVIDGKNGFVIEENNPILLAERIKTLIIDTDLRSKMSSRSRELYENNFTLDKMIKKYSFVFESVLKSK